jgi:hypothetical protein
MKEMARYFVRQLPTCIAVGGAIYLAAQGKDGWGWLLFVAVLLS